MFELWVEFEHWKREAWHPREEDFNASVKLRDGREYALHVWPYSVMEANIADSDTPYVLPPDLLVEQMTRESVETAIKSLIDSDQLLDEWLVE